MPLSHTVHVRFYGPLRDFLPPERRGRRFPCQIKGCPAVKDTLEALGVPHVEVDVILINRVSRGFSHQLAEGDIIQVYPTGRAPGADRLIRLSPPPPALKFVVDSHLGKLVRHLRLLGFDSCYRKLFPDADIAALAARQRRIVLTRDKGLLKYRCLRWGYWVRSPDPDEQIREVAERFSLRRSARPFSLCVECNGRIEPVRKSEVAGRLPPRTRAFYRRFYRCRRCRRVYWRGSHYAKMMLFLRRLERRRAPSRGAA